MYCLAVSGPLAHQYRKGSKKVQLATLQLGRLQDVYLDRRYQERFTLFVRGGTDNS
jgi:hypothetical protein